MSSNLSEVDNIIIIGLKDLGCEAFENEEISSLADLKPADIYSAVLVCLKLINENQVSDFPSTIPKAMTLAVNVCNRMSDIIKQLGFKGNWGYQEFVYPKPQTTRNLLMWLLENVPKKSVEEGPEGGEAVNSKLSVIINREISQMMRDSWVPYVAVRGQKRFSRTYTRVRTSKLVYPSKGRKLTTVVGLEDFYSNHLSTINFQPSYAEQVPPSIFEANLSAVSEQKEKEKEWNTKGLDSKLNPQQFQKKKADNISKMMGHIMKNAFGVIQAEEAQRLGTSWSDMEKLYSSEGLVGQTARKIAYTTESDVDVVQMSEEELLKKRQEEIEELQKKLAEVQNAKNQTQEQIRSMEASKLQIEAMTNEEETLELQKEYKIKKTTFDLLPNAEENILKLQGISSESSNRLIELSTEWEKVRTKLINIIRELRNQMSGTKDEAQKKIQKIKDMRKQIQQLIEEMRAKDEQFRSLLEVYNNIPQDKTRSHYTGQILETVNSVKKQKKDIDKTLLDIRTIQKEINAIADTLGRVWKIVDETVYSDVNKDPAAKEAYLFLGNLHEKDFKKLIQTVDEVGNTKNQILTLNEKIRQTEARTGNLQLEPIEKDLKKVKKENEKLISEIKNFK